MSYLESIADCKVFLTKSERVIDSLLAFLVTELNMSLLMRTVSMNSEFLDICGFLLFMGNWRKKKIVLLSIAKGGGLVS